MKLIPSSILGRLLVAFLIPNLLLYAIFAWIAQRKAQENLERALGQRLINIAQVTASMLGSTSLTFLNAGDENTRTAKRLHERLDGIRQHTNLKRIVVFTPQKKILLDTNPSSHIGDRFYHAEADSAEIDQVLIGKSQSSILFTSVEGVPHKLGYAPITLEKQVVAIIAVEGNASFYDELRFFRRSIVFFGLILGGISILLAWAIARWVTRPLSILADEAVRIGQGNLSHAIPALTGTNETKHLAHAMNHMREDLHHREEQLKMMLAGVAHEVRNPLGGIELFTGLLRDELTHEPKKLELLSRIERELSYLKNVVTEFLNYARPLELQRTSTTVEELLVEVKELCLAALQEKSIQIELLAPDPAAQSLTLQLDAEKIRRVLLNILQNAIQASSTNSNIKMILQRESSSLKIQIIDQGHGIAKEHLDRIFEPFFTTREKGTGLGLSLSQRIVEAHGGTLKLSSQQNQGTTATLTLPLSS